MKRVIATIVYRRLLLGYFDERHRQNERMRIRARPAVGRTRLGGPVLIVSRRG